MTADEVKARGYHLDIKNLHTQVEDHYPGLAAFRTICLQFDPQGVFRNRFFEKSIFRALDPHIDNR